MGHSKAERCALVETQGWFILETPRDTPHRVEALRIPY